MMKNYGNNENVDGKKYDKNEVKKTRGIMIEIMTKMGKKWIGI